MENKSDEKESLSRAEKRFLRTAAYEEQTITEEMQFEMKKRKLSAQIVELKKQLKEKDRTIELLVNVATDKDEQLSKYPQELYWNWVALLHQSKLFESSKSYLSEATRNEEVNNKLNL